MNDVYLTDDPDEGFDTDVITTLDNPYHPKEQFDKWYAWDIQNGYNTSEYIARLANYDEDDDDFELLRKYNEAIQTILENNEDIYRIV